MHRLLIYRNRTNSIACPWLALILALAVLLRIGVALYLGDVVDAPPLLTDQRSYHALGVRLLAGHGYSFADNWYPFTPANAPTAHWSFVYPLFVAGVYGLCGVHPLAVRLIQAALAGLLLPLLVYKLAKYFTPLPLSRTTGEGKGGRGGRGEGEAIPLLAAAMAALYGYFVLYAATLMTESFFIISLLWSLLVGLAIGRRLRAGQDIPLRLALALGLSLGLAALLRQSILPWLPVLFTWLFWQAHRGRRWRPALQTLALTGLILLLFILPWSYRNYRVFGQFLLLNSNAGYAMYSAQHPLHGSHFQEFAAAPLPAGLWGRPEAALDRELLRLGLQFIIADPGRYLLLCLSRLRAFFEFWPTADTSLLHNLGRSGSFGLLLPFILYGLYLSLRPVAHRSASQPFTINQDLRRSCHFERRRSEKSLKPMLASRFLRDSSLRYAPFRMTCVSPVNNSQFTIHHSLLLLFALFYTLLHVLTWAMVRYRLPVDAILIPFAALAMVELSGRSRAWLAARRRDKYIKRTLEFP